MHVRAALWRLRQETLEYTASLGHTLTPFLKRKKNYLGLSALSSRYCSLSQLELTCYILKLTGLENFIPGILRWKTILLVFVLN